jgi:hypothetical protein
MDYLNDQEKARVMSFVGDPHMMSAVKKVFLHGIYSQGVLQPGAKIETRNFVYSLFSKGKENLNNEQVGERLRAMVEGLGFLNSGFDELEKLKPAPGEAADQGNPAE